MREWWSKMRRTKQRESLATDLHDEIESHIDFIAEEYIAQGMQPEQARAASRRKFGNPTATGERANEAWSFPKIESILQDLRSGLRSMRKAPSFSIVVILTLALGIGATTAIFSVVYTVLLKPLPYPASDRLVQLGESTPKVQGISVTWVNFQHWKSENRTFEDMAAFEYNHFTMTGRGDPLFTRSGVVNANFFRLTGVKPILGRLFNDADDRPGAPPVVVLTSEFWLAKLGGDPNIVGSTLALNGKPYQVIGVIPAFKYLVANIDFYIPLGPVEGRASDRNKHGSIRLLARLKPGITLAQGRADIDAIMKRLAQADPGPESDHRVNAHFLLESMGGDVRPILLILMSAVGLVLLLACANVANLLLVRNTARAREVAIRTAIGAGSMRLARQILTENLLTAAIGGSLGVALAYWGLRALVLMAPRSIPRVSEASLDANVLLFAAGVTLMTGLLVGLAPVFAGAKVDLVSALKESGLSSTGGKSRQTFRAALVVAEIAITVILSFASGLLIRSLMIAQTSYPGFDAHDLLALELVLPSGTYKTDDDQRRFYTRLIDDLRTVPGVADAGAARSGPSQGDNGDWFYSVMDRPAPARGDEPVSLFNVADPSYFRTMKIRVRAGRTFNDGDRDGSPGVAVVNEELAKTWWPRAEMAVGKMIKVGGPFMKGPMLQIVGVVENVSQMGLDQRPLPEIYQPLSQESSAGMTVMIRGAGDATLLIPAIRRRVIALDRNLAIQHFQPFEKILEAPLARRRFSTLLLGLFAALAMILAAVGIYGVLNYWVSIREKEIAIRLAIGAQRRAILVWTGAQAMRLAAIGIVLGAAGAWAASRTLQGLVYGVEARNLTMFLAAGAVVIAISATAATVPVWRATRVDAVRNLHHA